MPDSHNEKERVLGRPDVVANESLDKGLKLCNAGRIVESLIYFRKAVEVRGDAKDLHWLGSNLSNLQRYEEALPYLKRAVELGGDAMDYHWLGSTLCHMLLYEQALPFLREAEKRIDRLVKDRRDRKYLHQANNRWLGETLLGLKKYREAERYLKKAVMDAHELEPLWFLDCLDVFRSCLEQTGSRPLSKRQSKKHAQKWEKALQSNTVEQYIQFLKAYPNSEHADVAKSQIHVLNKQKR